MTASIIDAVATYLGYTRDEVIVLSQRAPRTYRHYRIPKKKGGLRTIHHPSKFTKSLQYGLTTILLNEMPIHQVAVAYRRGLTSPLLTNAGKHAAYRFSVRIDFTDFFHSIVPADLNAAVQNAGVNLTAEDSEFVENCLFANLKAGQRGLAIGAPSSPIVSNIVMYVLDEAIQAMGSQVARASMYTRYADDIVFSTNVQRGCQEFYDGLCNLIRQTTSPRLTVNESKTVFSSRASRRVITGLYICPDSTTSLGRPRKRYIRKLLFDLRENRLSATDHSYLRGYLAFILDVEPAFYNRLALKYGSDLLVRASGGS